MTNTDSPLDEILMEAMFGEKLPIEWLNMSVNKGNLPRFAKAKADLITYCHKQVIEELERMLKADKDNGFGNSQLERRIAKLRKTL